MPNSRPFRPLKISPYTRFLHRIANHPFLAAMGVLFGLMTFGVIGYMWIEGWTLNDALFMTVITLTTIGYGEVQELSTAGRIFTIGLIIIGVGSATYALSATVDLLTSPEFLAQFRAGRERRALERIRNHTIICGFGRLGRNLALELNTQKSPFIIIDLDHDVIAECQEMGLPAIQGSAADEDVLSQAGVERANALVAAAKSDAENVFIILTARGANSKLRIFSRVNQESSIPKMERAGADTVISPYSITGRRIAQMVTRPNVVDFLDGVLEFGDHQMRLEEYIIDENSPLVGLTLSEAKLKVAVLAVDHPGEMLTSHPNANTMFLPGTAIIVMGVDEELNKLAQLVVSKS